jgi:hypothetical protein
MKRGEHERNLYMEHEKREHVDGHAEHMSKKAHHESHSQEEHLKHHSHHAENSIKMAHMGYAKAKGGMHGHRGCK